MWFLLSFRKLLKESLTRRFSFCIVRVKYNDHQAFRKYRRKRCEYSYLTISINIDIYFARLFSVVISFHMFCTIMIKSDIQVSCFFDLML